MKRATPLLLAVLATLSVGASAAVRGTVATADGNPVAGVTVYGSRSCCPWTKSASTTTDQDGRFRLEKPGAVIHAFKQGLQPRTVVIKAGESEVKIILEPLTSATTAPDCESPKWGYKRIGWGKYGLQFDAPEAGAEVLGGKPDVDYVRYGIKRKGGKTFLELWFGPYAMNLEPDDDVYANSANFQQRAIISSTGRWLGLDSWGHLKDGTAWRQLFVSGEGARYSKASEDDARFFNQIFDTFCFVAYPSH